MMYEFTAGGIIGVAIAGFVVGFIATTLLCYEHYTKNFTKNDLLPDPNETENLKMRSEYEIKDLKTQVDHLRDEMVILKDLLREMHQYKIEHFKNKKYNSKIEQDPDNPDNYLIVFPEEMVKDHGLTEDQEINIKVMKS